MPPRTERARPLPGSRLLAVIALCAAMPGAVGAHDPGLSSLEILVLGERVSAEVAIAVADLGPLRSEGRDDIAAAGQMAIDGISLTVDGQALRPSLDRVAHDGDGVRVRLSFAGTAPAGATLTVGSRVPAQLARGHRQLVTIRASGRVVGETLTDGRSAPLVVELPSTSSASGTEAGTVSSSRAPFVFGIEHILGGYDHLLFVAGLVLATRRARDILAILTAFTAAHSLTLAAAASGAVHAPASVVEPIIAASIAWVGVECLLPSTRLRRRWIVAFAFGLAHGFAFAEAWTELGRWSSGANAAVGVAAFTAGVETAQIGLAAALGLIVAALRTTPAWNRRIVPACSIAIVGAGVYWFVDRL